MSGPGSSTDDSPVPPPVAAGLPAPATAPAPAPGSAAAALLANLPANAPASSSAPAPAAPAPAAEAAPRSAFADFTPTLPPLPGSSEPVSAPGAPTFPFASESATTASVLAAVRSSPAVRPPSPTPDGSPADRRRANLIARFGSDNAPLPRLPEFAAVWAWRTFIATPERPSPDLPRGFDDLLAIADCAEALGTESPDAFAKAAAALSQPPPPAVDPIEDPPDGATIEVLKAWIAHTRSACDGTPGLPPAPPSSAVKETLLQWVAASAAARGAWFMFTVATRIRTTAKAMAPAIRSSVSSVVLSPLPDRAAAFVPTMVAAIAADVQMRTQACIVRSDPGDTSVGAVEPVFTGLLNIWASNASLLAHEAARYVEHGPSPPLDAPAVLASASQSRIPRSVAGNPFPDLRATAAVWLQGADWAGTVPVGPAPAFSDSRRLIAFEQWRTSVPFADAFELVRSAFRLTAEPPLREVALGREWAARGQCATVPNLRVDPACLPLLQARRPAARARPAPDDSAFPSLLDAASRVRTNAALAPPDPGASAPAGSPPLGPCLQSASAAAVEAAAAAAAAARAASEAVTNPSVSSASTAGSQMTLAAPAGTSLAPSSLFPPPTSAPLWPPPPPGAMSLVGAGPTDLPPTSGPAGSRSSRRARAAAAADGHPAAGAGCAAGAAAAGAARAGAGAGASRVRSRPSSAAPPDGAPKAQVIQCPDCRKPFAPPHEGARFCQPCWHRRVTEGNPK